MFGDHGKQDETPVGGQSVYHRAGRQEERTPQQKWMWGLPRVTVKPDERLDAAAGKLQCDLQRDIIIVRWRLRPEAIEFERALEPIFAAHDQLAFPVLDRR